MTIQQYFSPGQSIVLRQLAWGKLWHVRPLRVICDTPELRVLFLLPCTIGKFPSERITPAQRLHKSWAFIDREWGFGGILRLTIPGAEYSALLLRNADGTPFRWYVNLEDPMQRTRFGYDFEDNILDAAVAPDFSNWEWHDEDELEEAVSTGLYTPQKAVALYEQGKKAVNWIQSGQSPFNAWVNWKPDPSWPVPILPPGWDML